MRFKVFTKICLLLLLSIHLQAFAPGESQVVSLSFTDAPLQKVFTEIRKQTGYLFTYSETILAKARRVNINLTNVRMQDALTVIFQDQPLTYTIIERVIIIKEKGAKKTNLQSDLQTALPAIDIKGRVLNEREDPVAGVSVQIKGTKTGTSTNGEGEFELKSVPSNATLVLTGVNIESIETPVKSQLDIRVKGRTGKLDEVQVIAYGKTSQRFTTGNISTIKAEDIEKQPVQNPLLALQGRVPGLEIIQNSGVANGAVNIRLQGQNSIRALNDPSAGNPLIVVDGIPYPVTLPNVGGPISQGTPLGASTLSFINPADIESIDILKDADATAIYGSRAANGAILVTTKKGKSGKMKTDISFQQGFGQVPHKVKMMNRRQYLDMRYEAFRNDNRDVTSPSVAATDLKIWDTTRSTDWQETLIGGTASYTNATASLSGGTNTAQYLIGGTFNRTTTVYPSNYDDQRGSLHFSINGNSVNQRFKIQLSGSYMVDNNRLPQLDLAEQALKLEPIAPSLYLPDGSLNWAVNASGNATWDNPLYPILREQQYITKNLFANASISYTLLKNLEVKSNLGYSQINLDFTSISPLTSVRPERRPTIGRGAFYSNSTQGSWILEPQINYKGRISKLQVEILTGSTIQKNNSKWLQLVGSGYANDLLLRSVLAASAIIPNYSESIYRYNALFGRVNLNWDNRYILNLNARRDGSSRYGENNRFHNFGSAGLAWIFTEENLVKKNTDHWLSFGKIRASYGTTGSDQIADYNYLSLYSIQSASISYQGLNGLQVDRLPNPYLQWEETRKWQAGIDLGFFNDRVIINATYSLNRSSNQLLQFVLPTMTGFPSITQNFPATVKNTSWEFMLTSTNIKSKDFQWNSSINLTIPRNEVESFPNIEETSYASGTQGIIVGQPLGIKKTYKYVGIDPVTGNWLVENDKGEPTSSPSSATDRNRLISNLSRYFGGLQNQLRYKGIQLDFLFQFTRKLGSQDLYYGNGSTNAGRFVTGLSNQPITVLDRWQKNGDLALTSRYSTTSLAVWGNASDAAYSFKASYIRLRNASLSWQLPTEWIKPLHLTHASIYCLGQNLWTITGYTGLDPETGSTTLPPLRMITFGVKVGL